MDFGGVAPSIKKIKSRQDAITLQDFCDTNCTPSYRAPELYNIPNEIDIDQRSDVWSLGCILFALCFLEGPFDNVERSGSVALAVSSGTIPFPPNAEQICSMKLMQIIQTLLIVDAKKRPFVSDTLKLLDQ